MCLLLQPLETLSSFSSIWNIIFYLTECSIPDEEIFSIYLILPAALGPGIYSASNRNEYQQQKNSNVSGEKSAAAA
jgi:hypothetical protein